jgi:hypothetical protein
MKPEGEPVTALEEPATTSVEKAGRRLGIGRSLAYDAARRGEIPTLRIGRRLVVPVARLNEMLGISETEPREQ